MRSSFTVLLALCFASRALPAQTTTSKAEAEIEALNTSLADATRRMDNAAALALWADDGVSLLPSTKPIEGKKAIGDFLNTVTAAYPGARMESFTMQCHGLEIAGDWASEWCTEHQVVNLAADKPPFDGWGKMLLVLHRSALGWRITREMWNQALPGGEQTL